jgi:hypothetical protein
MVPAAGEVADLANAGISAARQLCHLPGGYGTRTIRTRRTTHGLRGMRHQHSS